MLLIDANCLVKSIAHSLNREDFEKNGKLNEKEYAREGVQRILDGLIYYKARYSPQYGEAVLAIDDNARQYWRKNIYECYKHSRTGLFVEGYRKADIKPVMEEWCRVVEVLKGTRFMPIEVPTCEADDVISALSRLDEKHLIISTDTDFIQLMSDNVAILDPRSGEYRSFKEGDSAKASLERKILDGDDSDDIPGVFSRLEPSEILKAWFKRRYGTELNQELFYRVSVECPKVFVEFRSDMYCEYYLELGYHEPNAFDSEKKKSFSCEYFYPMQKGKEPHLCAISRLPEAFKRNLKIRKEYESSFDKRKFLENDPLISYNYARNKKLIDLSLIPKEQVDAIINSVRGYRRIKTDLRALAKRYEFKLSDLK